MGAWAWLETAALDARSPAGLPLKPRALESWLPAWLTLKAGTLKARTLSREALSTAKPGGSAKPWAAESRRRSHHFLGEGLEFVAVEFLIAVFVEGEGSFDEAIGRGLATKRATGLRTTRALPTSESRPSTKTRPTERLIPALARSSAWCVAAGTVSLSSLVTAGAIAVASLTVATGIVAIASDGSLWSTIITLPVASATERRLTLATLIGESLPIARWLPLEPREALAGCSAAEACTSARSKWTAHGRSQLLAADRAVTVFVESEQGHGGVRDFGGIETAIAVGVERFAKRVHRWSEETSVAGHLVGWPAFAWGGVPHATFAAALFASAGLITLASLLSLAAAFAWGISAWGVCLRFLSEARGAQQTQAGREHE